MKAKRVKIEIYLINRDMKIEREKAMLLGMLGWGVLFLI